MLDARMGVHMIRGYSTVLLPDEQPNVFGLHWRVITQCFDGERRGIPHLAGHDGLCLTHHGCAGVEGLLCGISSVCLEVIGALVDAVTCIYDIISR